MEGIDLSFPSYAQHERMAEQIQHGFSGHGIRVRWQQEKQTSINCFHGLQQQQRRHGMERRIHCEAMIRQYQE